MVFLNLNSTYVVCCLYLLLIFYNTLVPIANLSPKIDKSNGSLAVTFARGDRGEINCFVMSDSDFTVDWFYNGWPIRDAFFGTEYEVCMCDVRAFVLTVYCISGCFTGNVNLFGIGLMGW